MPSPNLATRRPRTSLVAVARCPVCPFLGRLKERCMRVASSSVKAPTAFNSDTYRRFKWF